MKRYKTKTSSLAQTPNEDITPAFSFTQHTNPSLEAESSVPSISGSLVTGTESLDLGLSSLAESDGAVVCVADVAELVADAVGDDVGVEGFLLAFGDEGVGGEEGELVCVTAVAASDEIHGRSAVAEVSSAASAGIVTGIVAVVSVVSVVTSVVVVGVVVAVVSVITSVVVGVVVASVASVVVVAGVVVTVTSISVSAIAASTSVVTSVASVVVGVTSIVAGISVVGSIAGSITGGASSSASSSATVLTSELGVSTAGVDSLEVGEALSDHDLGLRKAGSVERSTDGLRRGSVGNVGASDIGVNERDDTTESSSGGKGRVSADEGLVDGEGVEVGLSGDETNGSVEDRLVVTEGGDLIRKRELVARAGCSKKGTGDGASKGGSLTRGSELKSLDSGDGDLLLAETSLDESHEGGDNDDLLVEGKHLE
jgi:hypothetical protein